MTRRDRDAQGSSPFDDEPTDALPSASKDGLRGFAPYRRDSDDGASRTVGWRSRRRSGAVSEGGSDADEPVVNPLREEQELPETTPLEGADAVPVTGDDQLPVDATDLSQGSEVDSEAPTQAYSQVDDVDRDDFHRRYSRRRDRFEGAERTEAIDRDADRDVYDDEAYDDDRGSTRARPTRARSVSEDALEEARRAGRRGTQDLGLLLLRVAVGLILMAHGAQKLFGWWNGPGMGGFEQLLGGAGFKDNVTGILAWVGALTETIGGGLLILGLATPIAASAALGVMLVAGATKAVSNNTLTFFASQGGLEFEMLLAVGAAVILLAGPGKLALDFNRGWARRPFVGSLAWLVVGIAAAAVVWIVWNGTNVFNFTGPATTK